MKVNIVAQDIFKIKADGLIVGIFEDALRPAGSTAAVDKALGGAIGNLIKAGEIKGKLNELNIIHSLGKIPARVVAIVGLGKKSEYTLDKIRGTAGQSCRALGKYNCVTVASAVYGAGEVKLKMEDAVQAVVEGAVMGLYSFEKYLTKKPEYKEITALILVPDGKANLAVMEKACRKGLIIAEAVNMARDMANEPGNFMKPADMAKMAQKIAAQYNLGLKVMERPEMEREGMGALLGVAQGSAQPPKFIILNYAGNKSNKQVIGFIGKGITFDSGGISIKPSENMKDMKGDMSGGAAVLATMAAISRLKLKVNITGIVAATENMPGGSALKPGDIVKAINGKTIEVVNTDAEGRLTLADALGYAVAKGFSPLVDVATLTGSCQVALGDICSGIFTNNSGFIRKVQQAAEKAGDCLWELPMKEEYRELNKSDVADVKNTGGRYGGAITAAMFLSEFVGKTPWVHVDIAGTFLSDKDKGYLVKGATGVPVRTLIALAEAYAGNG